MGLIINKAAFLQKKKKKTEREKFCPLYLSQQSELKIARLTLFNKKVIQQFKEKKKKII